MEMNWHIQTKGALFELIEFVKEQNFEKMNPQMIVGRGLRAVCAGSKCSRIVCSPHVEVKLGRTALNAWLKSCYFTCANTSGL